MKNHYVIKLWEVRAGDVNKIVHKLSHPGEQPAQKVWALRYNGSQQIALP